MKILLDGKEIYEISEVQLNIFKSEIDSKDLSAYLEKIITNTIKDNVTIVFNRLKKEWIVKLKEAGVKNIPLDDMEFAQLIFNQDSYDSKDLKIEI